MEGGLPVRRIHKISIALFCFLLVTVHGCEATAWNKLGQVQDGETITGYIDKDSIKDASSFFSPMSSYEIWEKWVFSPPRQFNRKPAQEVLYYTQYKKSKQYCIKEIVYVYANEPRIQTTRDCDLQRIMPDSINELVWNYIFNTYVPSLEKADAKK